MKVERHAAVIADDLPRIYAFIARDDRAAAERVLDAIELTLEQLAQHPESGMRYQTEDRYLADIRVLPVRGFRNYLIFYRAEAERVRILHVLHGAQHIQRVLRRERRS